MEKIDFFPSHKPINFTFTREGEMEWFKRSREPQGEGTHYGMLKENFKRETVVGTRYQKWSYPLTYIPYNFKEDTGREFCCNYLRL